MSTSPQHRRHALPPRKVSTLEVVIVGAGLVAAAASGVAAYRSVGLYGDGPLSGGYHRTVDPETGKSLLVHEARTSKGVVRRVIDDRALTGVEMDADVGGRLERIEAHVDHDRITRIDRDRDRDGRPETSEYYDAQQHLVKVGFSLRDDGVVDAWAFREADGTLLKIEVSTRRDGVVDRWEFYTKGQISRVELDTNHDGKVDQWQTYEGGILMSTSTTPPARD